MCVATCHQPVCNSLPPTHPPNLLRSINHVHNCKEHHIVTWFSLPTHWGFIAFDTKKTTSTACRMKSQTAWNMIFSYFGRIWSHQLRANDTVKKEWSNGGHDEYFNFSLLNRKRYLWLWASTITKITRIAFFDLPYGTLGIAIKTSIVCIKRWISMALFCCYLSWGTTTPNFPHSLDRLVLSSWNAVQKTKASEEAWLASYSGRQHFLMGNA